MIRSGIDSAVHMLVCSQLEEKMNIFPGILFLILVLTTPLTVSAAESSGSNSGEASAEQAGSADGAQGTDDEEEEPDCD